MSTLSSADGGHTPLAAFSGKRILLLQGPVGPFFWRLSRDLKLLNATVFKINFNGGDWFFYPRHSHAYKGGIEKWPDYLRKALENWKIDTVILYGDCRPIHDAAFSLQDEFGVEIYTFEEGYIRPNYVTFEKGRTNAFSKLPRNAIHYLNSADENIPPESAVGYSFRYLVLWGGLYHVAAALLAPVFPCRTYHRGIGVPELVPQLRSVWRKLFYAWKERNILNILTSSRSGKYFLVPLQVNVDSQVRRHSDFARGGRNGIEGFISHVMESFARNAPKDTCLIFKHHPMDRGYHDYSALINKLKKRHQLNGRVEYVHDLHLPTLINNARGVVVINSTVGFSAVMHGKPVKTCGNALYDIAGLTAPVSLDRFWRQAGDFLPHKELVSRYRKAVISRTQINGNFYKSFSNTPLKCGLNWLDVIPVRDCKENTATISHEDGMREKRKTSKSPPGGENAGAVSRFDIL